jgi:hypothetical protein
MIWKLCRFLPLRLLLPHCIAVSLRLSALIVLHFHTLKENIMSGRRDSPVQYQFSHTRHPLYLVLHTYPTMEPTRRPYFNPPPHQTRRLSHILSPFSPLPNTPTRLQGISMPRPSPLPSGEPRCLFLRPLSPFPSKALTVIPSLCLSCSL